MQKIILATAGVMGALGVILGAFGAHGLQPILSPKELTSFETGVRYQLYHAFFLMVIALAPMLDESAKKLLFILVLVGIVFFSVSIYLLSIDGPILKTSLSFLGPVTPIGGTFLIAAWIVFVVKVLKG